MAKPPAKAPGLKEKVSSLSPNRLNFTISILLISPYSLLKGVWEQITKLVCQVKRSVIKCISHSAITST